MNWDLIQQDWSPLEIFLAPIIYLLFEHLIKPLVPKQGQQMLPALAMGVGLLLTMASTVMLTVEPTAPVMFFAALRGIFWGAAATGIYEGRKAPTQ